MEQTYAGGTDWGREKMMTKPVFASLPSFFPFTKVKVAQLGPFPRQSPLIQRRSSGEGTMRGLLLARVGRGDTSSTQRRTGSRLVVWLPQLRLYDGEGTAKYRKYGAHFKATRSRPRPMPPSLADPVPAAEWPARRRKCVRTARVVTGTACSHRVSERGTEEGWKGEEDKRI